MSCEHARDCQRDNQVECTHVAIAKLFKRERPRVSLGVCVGCDFNTEKGKWPEPRPVTVRPTVNKKAIPPKPKFLPNAEQWAAWRLRVLPICQQCAAFRGEDNHYGIRMGCEKCERCGSKTIGPIDDCPLGKFKRWTPAATAPG